MRYIKMSIVFVTLIITTGCAKKVVDNSDAYTKLDILPNDTYDILNINDNITLAYGESKSIYIKSDNEYIEVCKTLCSFPEIAPDDSAITFVTGDHRSEGELLLYNFKNNEKKVLLDQEENIPIDAVWLDNERLIIIESSNEKINYNTQVCIYDIITEEVTPILLTENTSCFKSITKNGDMYEFEVESCNMETSTDFDKKVIRYNASEIEELSKEAIINVIQVAS